MIIMRPSHKQHVGLLPDDVSRGPKLSKPLSYVASLDSSQPLSSYHIDALASRLSPHTKDICRDKSTTVMNDEPNCSASEEEGELGVFCRSEEEGELGFSVGVRSGILGYEWSELT